MRIKKTLSIQEDVLEKAQQKADKLFAGNFSMYITFLINQDCEGMEIIKKAEDERAATTTKLDETVSTNINSILDGEFDIG